MEWTPEAEAAVKNVPFFVRKKVRAVIEKEAAAAGKSRITPAEVEAARKRFLSGRNEEITGFQVEICFGPSGCPNRAQPGETLLKAIEGLLKEADLRTFLESCVKGPLKYHHQFRVALAECPNACSQPQIKDIGIIGACRPQVTREGCTLCRACVSACREDAVRLDETEEKPAVDFTRCLSCGKCIAVCPTGTLVSGETGFRVLLGGKLGRHPRLAFELPGIYTDAQVLGIVSDCIALYKEKSRHGERFGEVLSEEDLNRLSRKYSR